MAVGYKKCGFILTSAKYILYLFNHAIKMVDMYYARQLIWVKKIDTEVCNTWEILRAKYDSFFLIQLPVSIIEIRKDNSFFFFFSSWDFYTSDEYPDVSVGTKET